jgi:hypothetical protein
MFLSGPAVAGHLSVVISAVGRRTFHAPAAIAADPDHQARHGVYLTDMLQPYGQLPGDVTDGLGHSYGEMAEAVITATVAPDEPVDLVVLAFAVPDIAPGRATATYLSHVCPGNPLAFAVCDNGTATAFTGLRIINAYLSSGACRSALLVVVEQADLHHDVPTVAPVPTMHTAVVLRLEAGDTELTRFTEHHDVASGDVGALLAAEAVALSGGHPDVTVVVGPLLAEVGCVPAGARVGDGGRPYTGLWWEVAGEVGVTGHHRRLVLADYDPQLRVLSLAATDVAATLPAGRRREQVPA